MTAQPHNRNMKLFLLLACLGLVLAKKRYDNYKVLSMNPVTDEQIQVIRDMHNIVELDFWAATDVMVSPDMLSSVEMMLKNVDMYYDIVNDNVQEELDAEEAQIASRAGMAYDLNNWMTYAQINEALDDFQSDCPSGVTCTIESMGSSINGNNVPALEIRSGNKPLVYLDSLIHCREWLAGATLMNLANRLIYGTDAEAERMRNTYNWYIAPVTNPDGYLYTWSNERLWRKNRGPNTGSSCIGTDLNRNFAVRWGWSGTSTNPCSDTYGGSSGASAIETQNVQNKLSALSSELHAIASYHAYGSMWLHAYGYTTIEGGTTCAVSNQHSAINSVANAARLAAQSTGGQSWIYGSVCTTIYPASGSIVDYAHDTVGEIYAFGPELRGTSFAPAASQIAPSYLEMWAALVAMVDAI